jgi:hypothetical protein
MGDFDLNINIQGKVDPSFLQKLKTEATGLKAELDRLKQSGQELTPAFEQVKQKLAQNTQAQREWNRELKGSDAQIKATKFQLLEYAENLTVVAFGIQKGIQATIEFGKELHDLAGAGAEFQIMYDHFVEINGGIDQATQKFALLKQAASGNFNNKEILDYINSLDELGYSTEQSTQILDFAERKSDDLGTTIEGATQKVVKFMETGRGRGFEQYGVKISDVNKKMEEMSGLTEKQIKNLTDESAQRLRSNAFLELYGDSLDKIKTKQQDEADKLKSAQKELENAKLRIGSFIAGGLVKLESSLGITNQATADWVAGISTVGSGLIGILPAIGGLRTALMGLQVSAGWIGIIAVAVTALALALYNASREVELNTKQFLENKKVTSEMADILREVKMTADDMAEAYEKLGTAIEVMTQKQLISAQNFVTSEIAKIEALKETVKQQTLNAMMKVPDFVPPQGMDEYLKQQMTQFQSFTDVGANLEKLYGLLAKIKTRYTTLGADNDPYKTKPETGKQNNEKEHLDKVEQLTKDIAELEKTIADYKLKGYNIEKESYDLAVKKLQLAFETNQIPPVGVSGFEPKKLPDEELQNRFGGGGSTGIPEIQLGAEDIYNIIAKMPEAFSPILGDVQNMVNILGIGADTFTAKLISGIQSGISLLSSVLSIINTVTQGLKPGGFLNLLFGAEGGLIPHYPLGGLLTGKRHAQGGIPLVAEGGEYIIKKSRVDALGVPLLNWLNAGKFTGLTNHYDSGGSVRKSSQQVIINKIYIKSALSGQEFLKDAFPDYQRYKEEISY